VTGTLAVDGWAVTFGRARRGLEGLGVTNGGVKSTQTPPCDILFFSVCLESPENQVTQTHTVYNKKKKIYLIYKI